MFWSDCELAAASFALSFTHFSRKDVRLKKRLTNNHLPIKIDSESITSKQEDCQPPVHPLSARRAAEVREILIGNSEIFLLPNFV